MPILDCTASPSTVSSASRYLAVSLLFTPTVSQLPASLDQQGIAASRITSRSPILEEDAYSNTFIVKDCNFPESARLTTPQEKVIGEIRHWSLLGSDWDGEGAVAPSERSMKEAVQFVRLLGSDANLPEPMLLASGRTSLYWNDGGLYADLEFLGDGRIAYFIRKDGDKHKGVLAFVQEKMPSVFEAFFRA